MTDDKTAKIIKGMCVKLVYSNWIHGKLVSPTTSDETKQKFKDEVNALAQLVSSIEG